MEIQIGSHGIVSTPDLHDGRFNGIHLTGDHSGYVVCSSLLGERYNIVFSRVRSLRATDFREGNIIHILWVLKKSQIPENEIEGLLFGKDWKERDEVRKAIEDVRNRDSIFVHIESSYGCDFKVLCETLKIEMA
jgi:hypothetical protein